MLGKLLRGAGLLSLAYVMGEAATLGRTVIFAQAMSPAAMGAVVMMLACLRLIEMVTDVSIERLILQAPDGASRQFQSHAHGASLLRGLVGALALLGLCLPLSLGFGLPLQGLLLLALVPLIRGFAHLDCRIRARHMQPAAAALVEGAGALAGLAAAFPAVWFTQGPEAVAWSSLAQVLVLVGLSHMLARRPYRASLSRISLARFWRFGWPLAMSALLLYAVFQGERLAVGAALGLEELGRFGISAQLALIPALLVGRVALSAVLPVASRQTGAKARHFSRRLMQAGIGAGIVFTLGFALTAPILIGWMFGPAYALGLEVICLMGAAAGCRMARIAPVTLLLARGESRAVLAGSALRAAALGVGTALAFTGFGLVGFTAAAAAGEALSFVSTWLRLRASSRASLTLKESLA